LTIMVGMVINGALGRAYSTIGNEPSKVLASCTPPEMTREASMDPTNSPGAVICKIQCLMC
jgi:hypothetical protein